MANLSSSKSTVFRAIAEGRRSAKRFDPGRTIPSSILEDVMRMSLRSPSGFNLQPTQIVLVEGQAQKDLIAERAMLGLGNQHRVRDCSALAVFLSDLEVSKRVPRIVQLEHEHKHRPPKHTAMLPLTSRFLLGEGHVATMVKQVASSALSGQQKNHAMPVIDPILAWSYKNTALMVQSWVLSASSFDLATCIMEGMDCRRLSRVLRIPDRYAVPMVVATGYDFAGPSEDVQTPRLPLEDVVFRDTFGTPWKVKKEPS